MECFICKEENDVLYKVCDCNGSTLCRECYNIDKTMQMKNCAICRKTYEIYYKRNYFNLIKIILLQLILFIIPYIIPIYIIYNYKVSGLFILFTSICIIILNILNIELLTILNRIFGFNTTESDNIYMKLNTAYTCFKLIFNFTFGYILINNLAQENYIINYYLYYVLCPLYIIPFLLLNSIILIDYCVKYIKKIMFLYLSF